MQIRAMQSEDWRAVVSIYAQGIATGFATFEKNIPTYEVWGQAHLKSCRIIAIDQDIILGWAPLSPVSSRRVYDGVAEVSVYVGTAHTGKGIGKLLKYHFLFQKVKKKASGPYNQAYFP